MTQTPEQTTIWLTSQAHERLQAQLEDLQGPVRQKIVDEISAARDEGDLKENGGYHAAREAQSKLEGDVRALKDLLLHAVSDVPADDGVVAAGKVVTYRFEGDSEDEAESFLLGARENEEYVDVSVFSPQAPLGAALMGATKGETVAFEAPNGRTQQVEVLDATPYAG